MELFRLLGTIAINNDEANVALNETSQTAEESHSKISGAFEKIGNAAVQLGKVVAIGIGACVTAISALTAQSMQGYADYEQLVGGVETLFGTGGKCMVDYAESVGKSVAEIKDEYNSLEAAQERVLKDANEAYRTAGMSANEYMETVTGFSAALIQSLDGDTEAAAEKANQAIVDMADNANKMGSSMESIQNAYQGFAKQNYTMLDNLKLGYGGTKEEMERLLKDAQSISGIKYDISSYADVVDAIHVIQDEMGITGTTALEASQTISGSVSSMKSAWSNLVAGFGNENADLTALIDEFIDSILVAADNVVPRIGVILTKIAEAVPQIIPKITEKLPEVLQSLLPPLLEGAMALFNSLVTALPDVLQVLIEQLPYIITQIGTALKAAFPLLLNTIKELGVQLLNYISKDVLGSSMNLGDVFGTLWDSIGGAFEQILPMLMEVIGSVLPPLLEMVEQLIPFFLEIIDTILPVLMELFEQVMPFIMQLVETVLPIIVGLVEQLLPPIMQIVQSILPVFSQILQAVLPILQNLMDLLLPIIQTFIDMAMPIVNLIAQAITPLMDSLMMLINSTLSVLQPLLETFIEIIGAVLPPLMEALFPIFECIVNSLSPIIDLVRVLFLSLIEPAIPLITTLATVLGTVLGGAFTALQPIIESVMDIFGGLIKFISGVFSGNWEEAWNGIVDMFKGIINIIPSAVEAVINGAIGLINGIISGINKMTGYIGIPEIPSIPTVTIPKLEEGGVLEKGQVGLLEGNGAEAVVPLEKNREWIGRVSEDMQAQGIGGSSKELLSVLQEILAVLRELKEDNDKLPEILVDAIANGLIFNINNREFARLVKAV